MGWEYGFASVSYTHLDVYKRQIEVNSMVEKSIWSISASSAKYPPLHGDIETEIGRAHV